MRSRFKDWKAYQKGFSLAGEILDASTRFPREEKYSLTDQIRRSSRSVCANLAECYGKRRYPKHFVAKLTDAIAENFETQTWLDFALATNYMNPEKHSELTSLSEEVGKLLSYMVTNSEQFR